MRDFTGANSTVYLPAPPSKDDADTHAAVEAELAELGVADGLPFVVPTADRISHMLENVSDKDRVWATVPPLGGTLTYSNVAYCAVLAGCLPGELPIVMTAVQACLQPAFNLLGSQTTTGSAAVIVIVHGPIVSQLGMNCGSNCLGPGTRANACIGRAVAATLRALGGARPGSIDMATMGQPAKFGCCFGEHQDQLISTRLQWNGALPHENAVTVLAASGMVEAVPEGNSRTMPEILDPVARLIAALASARGHSGLVAPGEHYLLTPPEVAAQLSEAARSPSVIQRYLYDRGNVHLAAMIPHREAAVATSPDDMNVVVAGGVGTKMLYLPVWSASRSVTQPLR